MSYYRSFMGLSKPKNPLVNTLWQPKAGKPQGVISLNITSDSAIYYQADDIFLFPAS